MASYRESVRRDVLTWLNRHDDEKAEAFADREQYKIIVGDQLWANDEVTGNGPGGGYFHIQAAAKEKVFEDFDTVIEALNEFCYSAEQVGRKFLEKNYIWLDIAARCWVLGEAVNEAVDEWLRDYVPPAQAAEDEEHNVVNLTLFSNKEDK